MNERGIRDLIGFGFGDLAMGLETNTKIDVVYVIDINEWMGNISLQGRIIDIVIK